ncbi:MAG: alpha/beta hydrolase [Ignavibacteriales bacterium]|nr:alpha/beta hydrolase [Ignavibacteriales bacterium]
MQFPELDYGIPIKYAAITNNNTIAYHEAGEGEIVLLFVHGLASYLKAWIKLIPLLSAHYRCIAIDLPGYGKSTGGVHEGSQKYYASVLNDFCRALNLQHVTCVGHSMGGQIALETALYFPELFKSLILLAPAGLETFTSEVTGIIRQSNPADGYFNADDAQIQVSYEMNFYTPPQDLNLMIEDRKQMRNWSNFRAYSTVVNNSLFGLLESNVLEHFNEFTIPALIVFGENDRFIPHPYLHKELSIHQVVQYALTKNSLFSAYFINQCGHFIPWEKPEETALVIQEFIKQS